MKTYKKSHNSMFLFGKSVAALVVVVMLTFGGVRHVYGSLIVRDFEGIPETYLYHGGGQNLGDYYPDLFFGPDVTVMDRVRYGYNDTQYPPHSGDAVIWADYSFDHIRVDFIELPSNYVEAWYTSTDTVYMEAYDAYDNLLDSAFGASNYPGGHSLISVGGANIAYVILHDRGSTLSVDDFGYSPIPEPATVALLGLGGLALYRKRRRVNHDGNNRKN